jgi:hypothetical protein
MWSCWCEEVSGGTAPFWPSSRLQRHFRAGGDRLAFGFMRYGASRPRASYQTAPRCAPRVSTRLTLAYSTLALSFRHVDWTACRYHSKWRHPRTPYGHCAGKKMGTSPGRFAANAHDRIMVPRRSIPTGRTRKPRGKGRRFAVRPLGCTQPLPWFRRALRARRGPISRVAALSVCLAGRLGSGPEPRQITR